MKTLTKALLAASAIAIAASAATLAAEIGSGPGRGGHFAMHMLERWDVDGNGAVTLEEFLTSTDRRFERADADNDDIVTEDEISAIAKGRGERRGMRHLERLDGNDDGKLSLEEATALAVERATRRFNRADADKDGFVSADEAGKIEGRRAGRHAGRFAGWMMDRFDVDGDGQITKAEADEHRKIRFARFDADDDGQVTVEEFQTGMKKFGGKHRRGAMGFGR